MRILGKHDEFNIRFIAFEVLIRHLLKISIKQLNRRDTALKLYELEMLISCGASDSKDSVWNAGYLGSIPGLGRSPGGGHGNPLQYSCLENLHGQRSLAGYSAQSCKSQTQLSDQVQGHAHTRVQMVSEAMSADRTVYEDCIM